MNDLISRQAAIAVADYTDCTGLAIEDVKKVTDEVIKGLKQLPPAQPKTCAYWDRESNLCALHRPSAQRKGKIIIRSNMLDGEDCYCSKCDHWGLMPDYEFCPYCGVAFEDVITEGEEDEQDR